MISSSTKETLNEANALSKSKININNKFHSSLQLEQLNPKHDECVQNNDDEDYFIKTVIVNIKKY